MLEQIDFAKARDILIGLVKPIASEQVMLSIATARVLALEIVAIHDVPLFDRSPYDGYVFRAVDTVGATNDTPVTLNILEEIPAGSMWTKKVVNGTASKILTGAPIPPGSDAVVKFEDTIFSSSTVTIFSQFTSGDNIIPKGEDVKRGQCLAKAGTIIDAGLAGTIAAQGIQKPLVYRRPRVAIVTTGSELADNDEVPMGAKIVNTNRYMFEAAIEKAGAVPVFIGAPDDDPQKIAVAMKQALENCDMVITTGGVSVGDYDLTPTALDMIGAKTVIHNLNIKPGGVCVFAQKENKLICCLSGNPASSVTVFYAVMLPALRKLCGVRDAMLPTLRIGLKQPFPKKSSNTRLLRGVLDLTDGIARMDIGAQSNGVLYSMIGCNVFAVVPAGSNKLEAGTILDGFLIE